MKVFVIALAMLLAGCEIAPTVQAANDRTVVVRGTYTDESLAVADATCAKAGRKAQLVSTQFIRARDFMFHYDCVN